MNDMRILFVISFLLSLALSVSAEANYAKQGDTVEVHYVGSLVDGGKVFDSSFGHDPLKFVIGSGSLLEDFEAAVLGPKPGDTTSVSIDSNDAYGPVSTDKMFKLERNQLPQDIQVGDTITLRSLRGSFPARVVDLTQEAAYLDANHMLAGKDIKFQIELKTINP